MKDNISVSNLIKLMISDVSAILTTSYDLFQVAFILTSIKKQSERHLLEAPTANTIKNNPPINHYYSIVNLVDKSF
ncbi:hypothetical protein [Lentilactobacillus hilgardii]|uniref:hypothetical protein n=1 Tax=Lentilactobacillus hilgardii TaxID=1588 RepID=UPI0021A512E8|nr:hypothetical protein [Lentilactobacillus hilgardii]MCT3399877.1 hypothetical protein [Lentilactobacillus hilgardii]